MQNPVHRIHTGQILGLGRLALLGCQRWGGAEAGGHSRSAGRFDCHRMVSPSTLSQCSGAISRHEQDLKKSQEPVASNYPAQTCLKLSCSDARSSTIDRHRTTATAGGRRCDDHSIRAGRTTSVSRDQCFNPRSQFRQPTRCRKRHGCLRCGALVSTSRSSAILAHSSLAR